MRTGPHATMLNRWAVLVALCGSPSACVGEPAEASSSGDSGHTPPNSGTTSVLTDTSSGEVGIDASTAPPSETSTQTSSASEGDTTSLDECGDAVLQAGEQCDDGNRVAGDGCDAQCRLEGHGLELEWHILETAVPAPGFSAPLAVDQDGHIYQVRVAEDLRSVQVTKFAAGGEPLWSRQHPTEHASEEVQIMDTALLTGGSTGDGLAVVERSFKTGSMQLWSVDTSNGVLHWRAALPSDGGHEPPQLTPDTHGGAVVHAQGIDYDLETYNELTHIDEFGQQLWHQLRSAYRPKTIDRLLPGGSLGPLVLVSMARHDISNSESHFATLDAEGQQLDSLNRLHHSRPWHLADVSAVAGDGRDRVYILGSMPGDHGVEIAVIAFDLITGRESWVRSLGAVLDPILGIEVDPSGPVLAYVGDANHGLPRTSAGWLVGLDAAGQLLWHGETALPWPNKVDALAADSVGGIVASGTADAGSSRWIARYRIRGLVTAF